MLKEPLKIYIDFLSIKIYIFTLITVLAKEIWEKLVALPASFLSNFFITLWLSDWPNIDSWKSSAYRLDISCCLFFPLHFVPTNAIYILWKTPHFKIDIYTEVKLKWICSISAAQPLATYMVKYFKYFFILNGKKVISISD